MNHFHLQSPAQQVAAEIRLRILRKQWAEQLPGITKLCEELGASRRSVENALKLLHDEKWIISHGRRAAMTICRQKQHHKEQGSILIYDTPANQRLGDQRDLFLALERKLPQPLQHLYLPMGTKKAELLREISKINVSHAVVLDLQGWFADALHKRGIRTVAQGTASAPESAPRFGVSYHELVTSAFGHLFAAGHSRVVMPMFQRKPNVMIMLRETVRQIYLERGLPYSDSYHMPEVNGKTLHDLRETTRALFKLTPPTAFVAGNFRHWLAVFSTLSSLGLRVPDDVSLICLSRSDDMDTVEPAPAHFSYPVNRMIRAILKTLDQPSSSAEDSCLFPPVWMPGASIAPPKLAKPSRKY